MHDRVTGAFGAHQNFTDDYLFKKKKKVATQKLEEPWDNSHGKQD